MCDCAEGLKGFWRWMGEKRTEEEVSRWDQDDACVHSRKKAEGS